jgi:hypothetical protein
MVEQTRDKRVLIVANEAVSGNELRDSLTTHLDSRSEQAFVVAPALAGSALKHLLGDIDEAIEPARERLEATLQELRSAGIDAEGEVGDSDPMVAIEDEIQKVRPDRIVLVAHRDQDGTFAEQGLLERARRELEPPVTEVVVDTSSSPHVLDVKETPAGVERESGPRPSGNLPPLSPRDIGGILVAVIGTLILALLAADSASDLNGDPITGASAARILIAVAAALVNIAHVVGLMLFQSTGYKGIWRNLFARLSLVGTPIAIIVSLLLGLAT